MSNPKISFSRNMDGDCLILIDGEVVSMAKDCEGWDKTVRLEVSKVILNEMFSANKVEQIFSKIPIEVNHV